MEKEKELKSTTIGLMVGTAIFFDVLQWLLAFIFMDWLAGFFAFMTFFVWFKLHGISFTKPKRLATMSGATLIELIPFLSALPAWTGAVVILALDSKTKGWVKVNSPVFNENGYFRVINKSGYEDFLKNKSVRSSPTGTEAKKMGRFNIGNRPTAFPSFSKGEPALDYAKKGEENYILESKHPMVRRGELNPVTQKLVKGRHFAHRPIDEETGRVMNELPAEKISNIYKIDKKGQIYKKSGKDI